MTTTEETMMTDHTEMQIPSDILEAARLTYEGLPIVYDGWDEGEVIRCIARAILAERERCALTTNSIFAQLHKI